MEITFKGNNYRLEGAKFEHDGGMPKWFDGAKEIYIIDGCNEVLMGEYLEDTLLDNDDYRDLLIEEARDNHRDGIEMMEER